MVAGDVDSGAIFGAGRRAVTLRAQCRVSAVRVPASSGGLLPARASGEKEERS